MTSTLTPIQRLAIAATSIAMALCVTPAIAVARPVSTPPDGGLNNCLPQPRILTGYIGSTTPRGPESFSDTMTQTRRDHWCSISYGDGSLDFKRDGLTLTIPATPSRDFTPSPEIQQNLAPITSNAEIVGHAATPPGYTVTMKVDGRDLKGLNGTSGWGMATRTGNVLALETAWFFYNDTDTPLATLADATKPLIRLLGTNTPHGFFVMTKRSGELIPKITMLPQSYVTGDHTYTVRTTRDGKVTYLIDGKVVATSDDGPSGVSIGIDGRQVDMVGQIWVDGNFWFPFPIPQPNGPRPHSVRMYSYTQGPTPA